MAQHTVPGIPTPLQLVRFSLYMADHSIRSRYEQCSSQQILETGALSSTCKLSRNSLFQPYIGEEQILEKSGFKAKAAETQTTATGS